MKLEEKLRRKLREVGHAYNTETSYVKYYDQFVEFLKSKRGEYVHPMGAGKPELSEFLTYLAVDRNNAPDTQRVAGSALKFLYEQVLEIEIGFIEYKVSKNAPKLPVVMSFQETAAMLKEMRGLQRWQSDIMYGCGLRISDCLRLRVKDFDFANGTVQINDSKGKKNRLLMMPRTIKSALQDRLDRIRIVCDQDREHNVSGVWMPGALEQKTPAWGTSWDWFWMFPASNLSTDPRSGVWRRHHQSREAYAPYMKEAKHRLGFEEGGLRGESQELRVQSQETTWRRGVNTSNSRGRIARLPIRPPIIAMIDSTPK